jgi:hypothetical protein
MDSDAVWALQNDPRVTPTEKLALLATFDRVWIPRKKFSEVHAALGEVSWRTLEAANAARDALKADPKARGICFQGTSTSEDMWFVPVDEGEEDRLLNIDSDPLCHDGQPHWRIDE